MISMTTVSAPQNTDLMTGSDIVVKSLVDHNVEVMFAYPGGASMEFHQALTRSKIRTILPRHEQGGAFMAHGYARATGKPGVCMATSGPGATNLVTAIADAHMDSIPLICITGQVYQQFKDAGNMTDRFNALSALVGAGHALAKHQKEERKVEVNKRRKKELKKKKNT